MTIQQCKYVLEIARTGSFSEAAKQLFIAQSSLSVRINSCRPTGRKHNIRRSESNVIAAIHIEAEKAADLALSREHFYRV